jgi:hypothetical protein
MRPLHFKKILFKFHHKIIPMEYPFLVCDQSEYFHPTSYHVAFGTNTWFGKAGY